MLCLIALAACSNAEQKTITSGANLQQASKTANEGKSRDADAVRAEASETRIKAGGSGEAVVRLKIAEGFHVNANPASDKYLIATSVEATASEGLKVGAPVYPRGEIKQLGFSQQPLAVYERDVSIKLPLSVEASTAKGNRTLDASITVQPCDDKECFQPRTIKTAIPIVIE